MPTIDLPPAFYDDHVSRLLPSGREISRTKKLVRVELDAAAFAELRSNADYYAYADLEPEFFGLVSSARATLRRLDAVSETIR